MRVHIHTQGLVHSGLLIFPSTSRGSSTRLRTPRQKPQKAWLRGVLRENQQALVHQIPNITPSSFFWVMTGADMRDQLHRLRRIAQQIPIELQLNEHEAHIPQIDGSYRYCTTQDQHILRDGLNAQLHIDSMLLFQKQNRARAQGDFNLPLMYTELMNSCIWRPTDNSGSLDSKVLSKALPQKCLRRRHEELLKKLDDQPNAETQIVFTRILIVSLLGNYAFVDARARPTSDELRVEIYNLLFDTNRVQDIITRYPHIMNYAVREYIVHMVELVPAMVPHMKQLFNWDKFRDMAVAHMNLVRTALVQFGITDEAFESLDVAGIHDAILRECYQRARRHFREELLGTELCSIATPPSDEQARFIVQRIVHYQHVGYAGIASGGSAEFQLCCAAVRDLQLDSPTASAAIDRLVTLEREWYGTPVAAAEAHADQTPIVITPWKPLGKRGMRAVLSELCITDSSTVGCLYFALEYLQMRGGAAIATADGVDDDDDAATGDNIESDRKEALRIEYATVYELPLHTAAAQMIAISEACGLPRGHVPQEMTGFHYCPVCGTLYNCIIQVSPVMKQVYQFGPRKGVSIDLCDDVLDQGHSVYHCTGSRTIGHIRCGAEPLVRVNILGRMIRLRSKAYFICCGPRCGFIAQYNPERCKYTANGYLCVRCTEKYYRVVVRTQISKALGVDVESRKIKCDMCIGKKMAFKTRAYTAFETSTALLMAGSPVASDAIGSAPLFCNAFIYPAGVILCDRHNRPDLAQYIDAHKSPFMTKDAVLRMCKAYTVAKKAHNDELHAKSTKIALSNARALNRSGRQFGSGGGS